MITQIDIQESSAVTNKDKTNKMIGHSKKDLSEEIETESPESQEQKTVKYQEKVTEDKSEPKTEIWTAS
jgi:hypothetical protein